ncbi:MAG TPA: type III-B CRISPR module RAMP protein Cmr1 [Hydrogenothermaceae bacterium]|nr:type III-B CRISPR module RAMP protein Cmr1 [Hydrogenothermaceae bacterium]
MQQIHLTIKTLTPTLMGGAFSQNDGIRPSEIKGMMRYWFRAVAMSIVGDDIQTLKFLEEKVFGSQKRKSPFRILIENFEKDKHLDNLDWENLPSGTKYLGFVINMNKERINNVIKAGTEFKIKLLFKNSTNENLIKIVAYSFYLATALGGFGLRSRRSFGSWQIKNIKTENIEIDFESLQSYGLSGENSNKKGNILNIIKNLIEELKNLHQGLNSIDTNKNLVNKYFIYIHKLNGNSWKYALNDLGNKYQNYRKHYNNTTAEYHNIKNFLKYECKWKQINKNEWNFAFGLPIQLNSRSNNGNSIKGLLNYNNKILKVGKFKIKHGKNYLERLPSSVWFSIKESEKDKYFAILTYLEGKLFPDEKNDEVIFEFDKNLKLKNLCEEPPKNVKVAYDANELKERAKRFVKEGLNNVKKN